MRTTLVKPARTRWLAVISVALVLNLCLQDVCPATPVSGRASDAKPASGPGGACEPVPVTEIAAVPPVGIAAWAAAAWYKTRTAADSVEPGPAQSYEPARLTFDTEDTDQPETPEAEPSEAAEGGHPVYKTWWFWAAVGGAAVVVAILAAIGGDSGEDLPDFPDPPDK
jgi:hypothetical protein